MACLPGRSVQPASLRRAFAILASVALLAPAAPARAVSLAGITGYEYDSGIDARTGSGAFLGGVLGTATAQLSLATARYDQKTVGQGWTWSGGGAVVLSGPLALRGQYSRILGDDSYRAWRAKAGPQFTLPHGALLQLWYVRYEDVNGLVSNAAAFEHSTPLVDNITAKLSGSYGAVAGGPKGGEAMIGATWTPVEHLELSAATGLADDAALAQSGPHRGLVSGGPLGGLLGGPGGTTTTENRYSSTSRLGISVSFP